MSCMVAQRSGRFRKYWKTFLWSFFMQQHPPPSPQWAMASSLSKLYNHTRKRPLPDKIQHSQNTGIHAPGGIRTRNPSKRAAAANPCLRPRGHWRWRSCDNTILCPLRFCYIVRQEVNVFRFCTEYAVSWWRAIPSHARFRGIRLTLWGLTTPIVVVPHR